MRFLIIGGAGFVGANLVRRCLAEPGADIRVLDVLDLALEADAATLDDVRDEIDFIKGDMRDPDTIARAVAGRDVIFCCAGQTSHPRSLRDPLLDVDINCNGHIRLLEAKRLHNPDALAVFTSSTTVIGRIDEGVADEGNPQHPLDIYSVNKSAVEQYFIVYHVVHDLRTVCLRFPNLFGPYGKTSPDFGVINYFIGLARDNRPITVYGDGHQKRDVLYIEDATELLVMATREPRLIGTTHFATSHERVSVAGIAEQVDAVFGGAGIEYVTWPEERKRIDVHDVSISSDRLRGVLDWAPRYTLDSGLKRTRAILNGESPQP